MNGSALAKTFFDLLCVIILLHHRNQGLLLTELGGQLLGMDHALAGAKRISNLMHSADWEGKLLEDWMWNQGDQKIEECLHPQNNTYAIWDKSEIEMPESLKAERLCAVRSVKAQRLKQIKPGYDNPSKGKPIFSLGFTGLKWWSLVSRVLLVWLTFTGGQPEAKLPARCG